MINVLLAGVGGQGTVLAAKVLAQAAQSKGWQVRTAETIGMAQRGGNVTSHVRMGSSGEEVFSSLITPGTADLVIALEPGEAARALPYLAPGGVLVTATTAIQPVTAALASQPYRAGDVVAALANSLQAEASREAVAATVREAVLAASDATGAPCHPERSAEGAESRHPLSADTAAPGVEGYPVPLFVPVDDEALVREVGAGSRKSLNMMLLAVAVAQNRVPLTLDEVKQAVKACVKPQFVAMNLTAIDHAAQAYG
ncbi:2-oxoacid:acceptor oxidoreductase family protein [Adlercreutzia sp. R7]|uniref:2-oxoacid:acceptor oxidoreductase family protein n=1 Tax=Adlercreutzia wanghongyangiae TaxID=3111451 RepID=A0ABU6IF84_9ACTN|nr:2-oxoacid:acceptor oxidoreductase family protein [Adlercreutzia sp. R7]